MQVCYLWSLQLRSNTYLCVREQMASGLWRGEKGWNVQKEVPTATNIQYQQVWDLQFS